MCVYHERLRVPVSWWLLGMAVAVILATEVVAGFGWLIALGVYAVIGGGLAAMLISWGRVSVDVGGGELRVGANRLPLAEVGEVASLDAAQTTAMRGRHADPAAYLLLRPYLRLSVYVEVKRASHPQSQADHPSGEEQQPPGPQQAPPGGRSWGAAIRRLRPGRRPQDFAARGVETRRYPGQHGDVPYWLIATRNPAELAAAINSARPATRADGPRVG